MSLIKKTIVFISPALTLSVIAEQQAKHPNVLVVITDDQGIGDFGFINPLVKTPNIDKIASESAVLTNFTACPASSPSRVSLYTGRNHLLTGVWGVPPRSNAFTDEAFMPQFYKAVGYNTFLLGKRDCTQAVGCEPWEFGWDNGFTVAGYQQKDPRMGTRDGMILKTGYTSEIMSDEAVKFIKSSDKKPWFISLNFITPHMPWVCSPEYAAPYKAAGYSNNLADCWGAITQMDAALGRVLAQIKKQGMEDNTIVLLYSDNGATSPEVQKLVGKKEQEVPGDDWLIRNVLQLRAYKSSTYQNGVRVPLLIKYPKKITAGNRTQFARVEDVLPTLLKLSGISDQNIKHQPFSGVSIADNLIDKKKAVKVPDAFRINIAHEGAPRTRKGIIENPSNLRFDEHHLSLQNERYVFHALPGGKLELYDLNTDAGEKNNIALQFPEITSRMAAECLRQWNIIISSGRAFGMPALQIGRLLWDAKPDMQNNLSAGYAQSIKGEVAVAAQAIEGFAKLNDEAVYKIDVVTPATYLLIVKGKNLDKCGSMEVQFGNRVFTGELSTTDELRFGAVDLQKSDQQFTLKSTSNSVTGDKATITQLIFSRNNN
jgi:arylsulfatase A-like enzyme